MKQLRRVIWKALFVGSAVAIMGSNSDCNYNVQVNDEGITVQHQDKSDFQAFIDDLFDKPIVNVTP